MEVDAGIERNVAMVGAFADDLPVHLTLGRNVDNQIPKNQSLATQSIGTGQFCRAAFAKLGLDDTD